METTVNNIADQKLKDLGSILNLLQSVLQRITEDIEVSSAMLPMGVMTELSTQLQDAIDNPLQNVIDTANNIDAQIKGMLHRSVVTFFRSKGDMIVEVLRSDTAFGDLYYSIVLKDDTIESRQEIFDFLERYDLLNIATKYPILFQFTPAELVDKVNVKEHISIK